MKTKEKKESKDILKIQSKHDKIFMSEKESQEIFEIQRELGRTEILMGKMQKMLASQKRSFILGLAENENASFGILHSIYLLYSNDYEILRLICRNPATGERTFLLLLQHPNEQIRIEAVKNYGKLQKVLCDIAKGEDTISYLKGDIILTEIIS